MKKALIINAFQYHEGLSKGELNRTVAGVIQEEMRRRGYDVWTTVLEQGYAIDEEVEKHLWADVIFLQTPVYWFGTPWIYKRSEEHTSELQSLMRISYAVFCL